MSTKHEIKPPARVVTNEDKPFWDALDAERFVLARCSCGAWYARSQACLTCQASAASLIWTAASGRGVVATFVVFEKAYHACFEQRLPYVVAVVELEEGPEFITNVIGCSVDEVTIGMAVDMVVIARGDQAIHQAQARL